MTKQNKTNKTNNSNNKTKQDIKHKKTKTQLKMLYEFSGGNQVDGLPPV